MRKNTSLRTVAIMLAYIFASGCAVQGIPEATAPPETATPQPVLPSPVAPTPDNKPLEDLPTFIEAGMQVEFWHPWSGETANLMAELSEQFNQENAWGIEVLSLPRGDERVMIQDIEAANASDGMPDAAALPVDYLPGLMRQGVLFQDLDTLIASEQWGLAEEQLESFFPVFMGAAVLENSRIGLPAYWSGYYLLYNQTWAGELGYTAQPATIADFEAQVCAAALNNLYDGDLDTNGTGGYVYSQEGTAFFSWMRAFGGGNPIGQSGSWQLAQAGDAAAGEFLYDLYLKDCAWTGRQAQPYQYFSNRLALFYSGRLEDILIQGQVNQLEGSQDQWTLVPYPSMADKPVVFIEGSAYAILTPDGQRTLAAWEWIKWLLEPQNQARLVETSGSFPLSPSALENLEEFRQEHPAWSQALQYLALADPVPLAPEWQMTKDVLSDFSWQLIRFTTSREDIPVLLMNAEGLFRE